MNTRKKGDALEDNFYQYLLEQKKKGQLVYGIHAPEMCEIFKKKKYYCHERQGDIEFDVVIELGPKGSDKPHMRIIFECKNYSENFVPESDVTDFSHKLSRVGKHDTKGILVVNTQLQRGAKNLAESSNIGIAKYNKDGLVIVANRRAKKLSENQHIENQIFENKRYNKSLKFSAFYGGRYHDSLQDLVHWVSVENEKHVEAELSTIDSDKIPYLPHDEIEQKVVELLDETKYLNGVVNLDEICEHLSVDIEWDEERCFDDERYEILGKADFESRKISIYSHESITRQRFTLSHEIGHFFLNHDSFLCSESILEKDLLVSSFGSNDTKINGLEYQANFFASCLLLPRKQLMEKLYETREMLDIRFNQFGCLIYVDDQHCNLIDYFKLLSSISFYFHASKQAIEIRLKQLKLIDDRRNRDNAVSWAKL